MKASSAHRLLPFETFGGAATFDLEVEVSCQCGRRVVIDVLAPAFRDRRIMGTRFRCTTILVPWRGVRRLAFDLHPQARPWPLDHGRSFARYPGPAGGGADRRQVRDLRLNRDALRGRVPLRPGLRANLHGRHDRIRRAAGTMIARWLAAMIAFRHVR